MKKFNITFPIAGVLHFNSVPAEDEQEAIEKCYELVAASNDPISDFDGEWEMYESLGDGMCTHVYQNEVDVQEVQGNDDEI